MPIHFACPCGARLNVPDNLAGCKARCPKCGRAVTVPDEDMPEAVLEVFSADEPDDYENTARPARRTQRPVLTADPPPRGPRLTPDPPPPRPTLWQALWSWRKMWLYLSTPAASRPRSTPKRWTVTKLLGCFVLLFFAGIFVVALVNVTDPRFVAKARAEREARETADKVAEEKASRERERQAAERKRQAVERQKIIDELSKSEYVKRSLRFMAGDKRCTYKIDACSKEFGDLKARAILGTLEIDNSFQFKRIYWLMTVAKGQDEWIILVPPKELSAFDYGNLTGQFERE